MSQHNTQPDSATEYAGWEAFDPELAPFLPTLDQSGGWNAPAHAGAGQPARTKAALPPNVGSVFLRAKAGSTWPIGPSTGTQLEPHDVYDGRESTNWNDDTRKGGSAGHSRVESNPPHTCAACSTSFPRNYQLEQHATQGQHKAYLCTCGKNFTRLSALGRHMKETTQAREHRCLLCDHEFKRPGHVEQHLRLIHQMSKDAIKDLLVTRKPQSRQESGHASVASAVIPAGPMNAQVHKTAAAPEGPWTGPIDFAPALADHPGTRPGDLSTFFSGLPTSNTWLGTETPAFTPQSFMPQAADQADPAYQTSALAIQSSVPVNTALDFVGYPAAHSVGDLDLSNMDPALVSLNPVDSLGRTAPENYLMGEFFDIDLSSLDS